MHGFGGLVSPWGVFQTTPTPLLFEVLVTSLHLHLSYQYGQWPSSNGSVCCSGVCSANSLGAIGAEWRVKGTDQGWEPKPYQANWRIWNPRPSRIVFLFPMERIRIPRTTVLRISAHTHTHKLDSHIGIIHFTVCTKLYNYTDT